ncbi:hypothetical protein ACFQQF_10330 [Agrococcus sp. GCM10030264]
MHPMRHVKGLDFELSTGPIREESDEHYVLSLCERLVGRKALRQHCFDWLRADPDARGSRRRLPVDAYWPEQAMVALYRDVCTREPVLAGSTVSPRTEQRRLYDERRRIEVRVHHMGLIDVSSDQLAHKGTRLLRDVEHDLQVLQPMVAAAMP